MPSSNYINRILPSMASAFELDCDYRCERDLHHHLTALFNRICPLRIGEKNSLVRYEKPTCGTYRWSGASHTSGNIDIFFEESDEGQFNVPSGGTAVEINCNYTSTTKTKQDLIKLLDQCNQYGEAVYIVVGTEREMKRAVEVGCDDALVYLATNNQSEFQLPISRVLLIEELGGWRFLYEGVVVRDAEPTISWNELKRRSLVSNDTGDDPMRSLSRSEAKQMLNDRMRQEGIPLRSITARCMFEPTKTSDGRQLCHFGKTPLWDHVVDVNEDQVVFAVFSYWLDKLTKYGKSRQR